MQQHTNNWDVGKLFSPSSGLPPIDVQPLGYGWIYNIFCGHKCFDVTIGNYPCCFCIYFIVMSITSLGGCGAWVQCKHLYHILWNIMYCGQSETFIHYPTWSWDKVQWLLACAKAFESPWYYNKIIFASGFGMPILFSLFIVQYVKVRGELPTMM
jgi:hypothetical protein